MRFLRCVIWVFVGLLPLLVGGCLSGPAATPPPPLPTVGAATPTSVVAAPTLAPSPSPAGAQQPDGADEGAGTALGCPLAPTPAPTADSAPLRLLYQDQGRVWVWQEETGKAVSLPEQVQGGVLSPDGQLVAYHTQGEGETLVLWVAQSSGSDPRQVAQVAMAETRQRHPNAVGVALEYEWLEGGQTLAVHPVPIFDAIGEAPFERVTLVDVAQGVTREVIPGGEIYTLAYTAAGNQVAARAAEALWLIDAADGTRRFTIPLPFNENRDQSMRYSPDGRFVVLFVPQGLVIVETSTGQVRELPLAYESIGLGHTSFVPEIFWVPNTTSFYTVVPEGPEVFTPDASFTVWEVDVVAGTTKPLNTFVGSFLFAQLTPDRSRVAFWTQEDNYRELFVADVLSGAQVLYEAGPLIEFLEWNQDSTHFLFWFFQEKAAFLGHPCQPPAELGLTLFPSPPEWVDQARILAVHPTDTQQRWEIRLHTLHGENVLVAEVSTEQPFPHRGPRKVK